MVKKLSAAKIWLFVSLGILAALIIAFLIYVFAWQNVYIGVKCCGVSVSNMKAEEVVAAIRDKVPEDGSDNKIKLSFDGHECEIALKDFEVHYDISQTADEVLQYGRDGNVFKRMKDVFVALFGGYDHPASFSYNADLLSSKIDEDLEGIGTPVVEHTYKIEDGKFYIINGTPGDMPNKKTISDEILKTVGLLEFGKKLAFEKETREPEDIDVDALHSQLSGEVKNATYELSAGGVTVVPHRYKVEFDKGEAKKIISKNKGAGKKYSIPATVTEPDFLEEDAKERLFSQTLGEHQSKYNQGDTSRSSNVALAAKLVNGTIIMPGGEFSYNTVVGKRTAEAGFKVAHVYMNNEVVDGIGGGICQVSSTLYCAVLYSNLQVTERVNHQLAVSYVPLGQDATVDYGNIDFRFKNNTAYPIKIVTEASGGVMYARIEGYRDVKETVTIENKRVGVIPPRVEEEEDPELPFGEKKEVSVGDVGYVVETYKTVTINGNSKTTMISKSSYASGKSIVKVGTGPTPSPEPGEETEEGEDAPSASPSPSPTATSLPKPSDED